MDDYMIEVDEIFCEELTVENLIKYGKGQPVFRNRKGKRLSKNKMKQVLADRIIEADKNLKRKENGFGRINNGRYASGNRNAEKFSDSEDDIYLLYLLCDNMDEVAEFLGVCRQTVSRKIKRYKGAKV